MGRRTTESRRFGIVLVLATALGLVGSVACQDRSAEDELQTLLHDEDFTKVTRGALQVAVPSPTGASDAGSAGTGGKMGTPGVAAGLGAGGADVGGASDGGVANAGGAIGTAGFPGKGGSVGTDASAGMGGAAGGGPFPPPSTFGPLGQWNFDNCNPSRTELFDSSGNGDTAFRAVSVTCSEGASFGAVSLADKDNDIVYVPDQPFFNFAAGVTVGAWFNATSTNRTSTLFRKRDDGSSSSFVLLLNDGKYQFVVNLSDGRAASVSAPGRAKTGVWTHVAATYDGMILRLYVDGREVARRRASGAIAPGAGPFLMGNDGSKRLFSGAIDEAFLDSRALSAAEIVGLTCIRRLPTLVGTPPVSAPTASGVPVTFDIALANNDSASCLPTDYQFNVTSFIDGIAIDPSFQFLPQVAAGTTSHLAMNVTGSDDLDSGTSTINFQVFSFSKLRSSFVSGSVDFTFVASGCRVSKARELMIKSLPVVDDPVRTAFGGTGDPRDGVWTFKHLMENMAPTSADAPKMVEDMFKTFSVPQTINGFTVAPRPFLQTTILDAWPRTPDGALDLAQAPLQLQAIVSRFDLRSPANGDAGEGRFVFAFTAGGGSPPGGPTPPGGGRFPLQATLIFEYKLPAASSDDVLGWANAWHALGAMTFPSEEYNAALQVLTERFAGRGAFPHHPNDSAINTVRTNEIDFGNNGLWELREFVLASDTGLLGPATVKLTPDLSFNNTATLASFINANEASIIAETDIVPDQFMGNAFLGGAVFNDFFTQWTAPGINNPEARFHFAVNTCNGCHSIETGVSFLQISPRFPGSEAFLSPFLTGTTVFDRITGGPRNLNELARRAADLKQIVCPDTMGTGGSTGAGGDTGGGGAAGGPGADGGGPTGPGGSGGSTGGPGLGGGPGVGGRGLGGSRG